MSLTQRQMLLRRAAEETLERIQADRSRAPRRLQPLLAYIADHLFDPDLNVNQLKRACGVRNNSVPVQFHSAVGSPPGAYISDRRLEVAGRLLRDSELPVWQIAELVGYSTLQVFSEAFARWAGKRPTRYRKEARRAPERQPKPGEGLLTVGNLRQACAGSLDEQDAQRLIDHLTDIYSSRAGGDGDGLADVGAFSAEPIATDLTDRPIAEAAWQVIRSRPMEDQLALVRDRFRLSSPALFHLLLEKSREEGRHDRQRGVQLAELALESLYACGRSIDELRLLNLRARGWTWLGNARRLVQDMSGAERALQAAEGNLPLQRRDRRVLAELLAIRAVLTFGHHRVEEALGLQERAISLFKSLGDASELIRALLLRVALRIYENKPQAALRDLEETELYVDDSTDPSVRLILQTNTIACLILAERFHEAARQLPAAMKAAEGDSLMGAHLNWTQGLAHQGLGRTAAAEQSLLAARQTFIEEGDSRRAAVVNLDLIALYSETGRSSEAMALATEILPILHTLEPLPAAAAVSSFLRDGLNARQLAPAVVQGLRPHLIRLRHAPNLIGS